MPDFCLCVCVEVETTVTIPSGSSLTFPGNPPMTLGGSDNIQVTIPAGGLISFPVGERLQVMLPRDRRPAFDLSAGQNELVVQAPDGQHTIPYPPAMVSLVDVLPELGPGLVRLPPGTVISFPNQANSRPFELPQPSGVAIRPSTFDFRHIPRDDFE